MTMTNIIRHKNLILTVVATNQTSIQVCNNFGKPGVFYPKSGKLVFRSAIGRMTAI